MLKKNLVILFVCVALDFVMVMVGWTAETISSEKLICKVDFSSGIAESLTVSPDNMHVAYGARKGNKWFVVVDGQEGKQYDGLTSGTPIFSPDNKRVAYGAMTEKKWFVVVDGQEGKQYDGIVKGSIIKFNPDGSIYYLAIKGNGTYLVTSQGLTKVDSESKATPNVGKSEETK